MKWFDWLPALVVVGMVGGILTWFNVGGLVPSEPVQTRSRHCQALVGTPLERLHACYAEIRYTWPSPAELAAVQELEKAGKVMGAGVRFSSDNPFVETGSIEGVEATLLDVDEERMARGLRELSFAGLVVHRDLVGALDRDRAVLARLAYHDFLEWFELTFAGEQLLVYRVRNRPATVPLRDGEQLLKGLRARLAGRPVQELPVQEWQPHRPQMIASLRLQGATLARQLVESDDVPEGARWADRALDLLGSRLLWEWERRVEPKGLGELRARLPEVRLEVHLITEMAEVEPRSALQLFELWEPGIDGALLRERPPGPREKLEARRAFLPGSVMVTQSLRTVDAFLRAAAAGNAGWREERPWTDPRRPLALFRDQHFLEKAPGGGAAVRLMRGMPEVSLASITPSRAREMLVAGGAWWVNNWLPDNRFEYKYWPVQNRRAVDYNEVRHILATRDLVAAWRRNPDPRYLAGAEAAMQWLLQFEVKASDAPQGPLPHPPEGTRLFRYPRYGEAVQSDMPPNQKLGTVAVALLGWVEWARATGSSAEDERIREMARFVKDMQLPDGSFRPYFVHDEHPYAESRNDIVPGEAMLALAKVATYFGDSAWIDGFSGFLAYYQPWFRERAQRRRATGRWPHGTYENQDRLDLVQLGPWTVMAAHEVYTLTDRADAAAFGLEVADWMIDSYQWSSERSPWPDFVGGYFKLPQELPAMQSFCYAEGTAAAFAIARRFAPEREAKYERATAESLRFLEVMQFDEVDSYFVPRPEKIRGGVKYAMNENKIRIDYVGHGLSALAQYLDAAASHRE